jgi:hypothetical protein
MMISRLPLVALAATIGAAYGDSSTQPDTSAARTQVRRVIDAFRTSIISKDKATLNSLFLPPGSAWVQVAGDGIYQRMKVLRPGVPKIQPGSAAEFINSVGATPQRLEEKFSNLRIDTDGAIASVYFDYVFLKEDKEQNRGSETWQLVNTGDGWKISALSYSVDEAALE